MTYIEEYYNKIMSGEIVACHRIKQVYSMLVDKLHHPEKYEPYIFDEELANLPIEFIETFIKQAQGELGANLKLELFQKAKHQAVFGFVHKDTYLRQYNEVLDIRGRKNGKTTELAADEIFMAVGDGEGSPEIYNVATKLDQAYKGFQECYKMIQQSKSLSKHFKKRKVDFSKTKGSLNSSGDSSTLDITLRLRLPFIFCLHLTCVFRAKISTGAGLSLDFGKILNACFVENRSPFAWLTF